MSVVQAYSQCDTPDGMMICGPHAQTVEENCAGGTVSSVYCIRHGRSVCIVDTGRFDRIYELLACRLREEKLRVAYIILTHDHYDHVGNALKLRAEFGGSIVAHCLDAPLMENPLLLYQPEKLQAAYGASSLPAFEDFGMSEEARKMASEVTGRLFAEKITPDLKIEQECSLDLNGLEVRLLHTPGHSPGSLSVYIPASGSLYTGDLTFWVNPCRPFSIGNAQHCQDSLRRVLDLEPAWCGPGHGGGVTSPLPWLTDLLERHERLEVDLLNALGQARSVAELRARIFPDPPLDSFTPIPENSIQACLMSLQRQGKVERRKEQGQVVWLCSYTVI